MYSKGFRNAMRFMEALIQVLIEQDYKKNPFPPSIQGQETIILFPTELRTWYNPGHTLPVRREGGGGGEGIPH